MKLALSSVATCAAAAMVSTIGLTSVASATTPAVTPTTEERSLTSVSQQGLQVPGARSSSDDTAQVTNRSALNLPDLLRAPEARETLKNYTTGVAGTFGSGDSAQNTSLGNAGESTGNGDLEGSGTPTAGDLDSTGSTQVPSSPSQTPDSPLTGGTQDRTEDGVKISAISEALSVPTGHSSIVGVTSSVQTGAKIEVRTQSTSGDWGAWSDLEYEANESDSGGSPGTAPFVVSDSSAVQIRVLGDSAPADAKLVVIDPKHTSADDAAVNSNAPVTSSAAAGDTAAAATNQSASTQGSVQNAAYAPGTAAVANTAVKKVGKPAIASRSAWGANEGIRKGSPSYASSIKAAIVHQTEGSNSYSASDVPGIIRGIYSFHVKQRGWADIGYNVLADRFGRLWQGRAGNVDRPVVGAHARGFNTGTFGISVMGSYNRAQPTAASLTAVEQAIAWKLSGSGVSATGKTTVAGKRINVIAGHRDVGNTDCPGANLYNKLGQIRTAVAKMQATGGSQPPASAKPTPAAQPTVIQKAYKGKEKTMGATVGKELAFEDGWYQQYRNGFITYTSKGGARVLTGGIANAWAAARGSIGLPTNNETKLTGGAYQSFARGSIHWSPATGAKPTWGDIARYWGSKGYERGHLGYPTSAPTCTSSDRCEQNFANARLSWVKGVGVTESSLGGSLSSGAKDKNAVAKPVTPKPSTSPTPTTSPKPTASAKPKPTPTKTTKPKQTEAQKEAALRKAIIKEARKHLGVRYVWGGTSPTRGWDCSGYVQYVYKKNGIKLPRTSGSQKAAGEVIRSSQAKPGDLIWHPGHIAIVSDKKGYLIDAGSPRTDTSERKWDWMLRSGGLVIRVID